MTVNVLSDPIVDFGQDAINVGEDILNTINPANWSKFCFLMFVPQHINVQPLSTENSCTPPEELNLAT